MDNTTLKQDIQAVLSDCQTLPFNDAARAFFKILGYETRRQNALQNLSFEAFDMGVIQPKVKENPTDHTYHNLMGDEWLHISQLFQLTEEDVLQTHSLFSNATKEVDAKLWQSYLFFGLELKNEYYTRTQLSAITRDINRVAPMPAMLLFKHGNTLTFAVINRRLNQKNSSKKVVEKVTLIKDIKCENTHRAHLDILSELALKQIPNVRSFNDLHEAWRGILDLKALNNRFYKELFTWYLWARKTVNTVRSHYTPTDAAYLYLVFKRKGFGCK
jgi:adenine-specific DNA-methyltransferase